MFCFMCLRSIKQPFNHVILHCHLCVIVHPSNFHLSLNILNYQNVVIQYLNMIKQYSSPPISHSGHLNCKYIINITWKSNNDLRTSNHSAPLPFCTFPFYFTFSSVRTQWTVLYISILHELSLSFTQHKDARIQESLLTSIFFLTVIFYHCHPCYLAGYKCTE